jgi:ABC-type branched-subunit amino acid transport system ATPase component
MTLLKLERVTRRFGGLLAVDAIDLNVEQGGVTAIIGPNGAGKTTLFHLISGFQTPNGGRIVFDGQDITGLPPDRIAAHGLIRTFQLVQLFRDLSAIENVKVGCRVEMWRGGCRLNIAVAASFVWRCLSGSTMTPFPHPAHRTGQADFPHPALGQDLTPFSRATPSAVSEHSRS